ncbi:Oidioi.mRNA.OKI2018_I69.chr1.g1688.t1.cds [Oikopleura dioica]|uniref:Oidioi.mRNA.OKI2018_I69.chr1.g1688.t1.cds n=1 Tax=Oikopleura dioica TaxID=34765 RepID=A0ABN7SNP2_OIKDI|nr:Oidioi.mRNA.OKI2018_I69.chr1.g1688.t1.cds [Oikopleura dioica]
MSKSQIASAGYFQQYASLTAEERESRRVICDAKIDETQAAFPIENGSWACPGYGQTRSKVRCHPTCGQGFLPDWTEKSISKPKKDAARFMARCGDPATIVRKNLPIGMELKCSAKPAHPCIARAATIAISDGRLELANVINKKRASYQVVCEDGSVSGRVHCFQGVFNNPKWNRDAWKSSCVGKTTTVVLPSKKAGGI